MTEKRAIEASLSDKNRADMFEAKYYELAKLLVRSASPAVEELVRELREVIRQQTMYNHQKLGKIENILAKYCGTKGE